MKKVVFGFCALTVAAWLLNFGINPPAMNAKALIHEVFYLNGVLAWGLMAMAIVIAARPAWLEKVTGTSLDELYKWHKNLGIWAGLLTLFHYFTKALVLPLIKLLPLEAAPKVVRGELAGWDAFWSWLRGFAMTSSEVATLVVVVLVAVSFVGALRYHRWLTTHRLFSIAFLILSIHCIRLMDMADAFTPFGLINIAVTVIGCIYSVQLLVRGAGHAKTVSGTISNISAHEGLSLITVKPNTPLKVRCGEFVFLSTPGHEKHPFSISAVNEDGTISFAVKALGDYTSTVIPELKKGQTVTIEGPWGRFRPDFSIDKQLWVAGGVGIAPFCAWLQDAASHTHGAIRLVWCIKSKTTEPMVALVEKLAERAGIKLEIYESEKSRLNTGTLFSESLPETVSLCAGQSLACAVSQAYVRAGGNKCQIRSEHFNWR